VQCDGFVKVIGVHDYSGDDLDDFRASRYAAMGL